MKTTFDIPDVLLRRVKARAALKGASMREFVVEAVEEKLSAEAAGNKRPSGWRRVFGKAPKGAAQEVQAVVDSTFETVDSDEWK